MDSKEAIFEFERFYCNVSNIYYDPICIVFERDMFEDGCKLANAIMQSNTPTHFKKMAQKILDTLEYIETHDDESRAERCEEMLDLIISFVNLHRAGIFEE